MSDIIQNLEDIHEIIKSIDTKYSKNIKLAHTLINNKFDAITQYSPTLAKDEFLQINKVISEINLSIQKKHRKIPKKTTSKANIMTADIATTSSPTFRILRGQDEKQPTKTTVLEVTGDKLADLKSQLRQTTTSRLGKFLDEDESAKFINPETKAKLLDTSHKYALSTNTRTTNIFVTGAVSAAVDNAIKKTLKEAYANFSVGESPQKIDAIANTLADVLLKTETETSIQEVATKIYKYSNFNGLLISMTDIIYDPNLPKTGTYSVTLFHEAASTLIKAHEEYGDYGKFFKKLGLNLSEDKPIFVVDKSLNSRTGSHLSGLDKITIGPNSDQDIVVHEITHSLQKIKEDDRVDFKGKSFRSYGDGMPNIYYPLSQIVMEAGAQSTQALYLTRDSVPLESETKTAFIYSEYSLFEKRWSGTAVSTEAKFTELFNEVHTAIRDNPDPHKALYELLPKDYDTSDYKYQAGLVLAALLQACNDYDTKQTLQDLVNITEPFKVIEKISIILKTKSAEEINYVLICKACEIPCVYA